MQDRKLPCLIAAGFVATTLTLSATAAWSAPIRDVVVEGRRIDPDLQRVVSYKDLNLAFRKDVRTLDNRIYRTAKDLCFDINSEWSNSCTDYAVASTREQKLAAIERAKRQMAGLPVGPAIAISMVIGGN